MTRLLVMFQIGYMKGGVEWLKRGQTPSLNLLKGRLRLFKSVTV